jgi:fatty acid desaturase
MNVAKARVLDSFACRRSIEEVKRDPRYRALSERLERAGFFAPAPFGYAWRFALLIAMFALAFASLALGPGWPARLAAWALLGFVMVQAAFMSHEAMHGSVSRRRAANRAWGHFFDTFLIGFSFSYFTRSHDVHHFHCNEEGTDPDTLSTLFSVFESSAREKHGLGRLVTRVQHVAIPALFPMWALGMKWDALTYVVRNWRRTRVDQLVLVLHVVTWFVLLPHWIGFGAALVNYLGMSAFTGIYLAILIPVNHVAREVVAPGAQPPFLEQQLVTTRNLGQSVVLDWLFIGLNSHVEHHLFPWVPSSRLRRGRAVLARFCHEHGLPYCEQSYARAVADVFRHFYALSRIRRESEVGLDAAELVARADGGEPLTGA